MCLVQECNRIDKLKLFTSLMLELDGAAYFYMMATVTLGEVDVAVKTSMLRT
jgi:hypothetical protein